MSAMVFGSSRFGTLEIQTDEVIEFPAGLIGLGDDDPSHVDVWVTVRAATELEGFTANLRAPILVLNGRGHQVINQRAGRRVRAPLFRSPPSSRPPEAALPKAPFPLRFVSKEESNHAHHHPPPRREGHARRRHRRCT